MQLATDVTDFAEGSIGLVEKASTFLNDRLRKQWSKGELISYINDAQWWLAATINRLHKEHFLTNSTTPQVAGQAYYQLPSDLAALMSLEVVDGATDRNPREIVSVHISDRRFYEGLDQATKKDDYRFYFVAGTTFKELPEGGTVNGELMRAHYVKRLARLVLNEDVSEIPEQHHVLIAMDAARLAMVKTKQSNAQLEKLRAEALDAMMQELRVFTIAREERVEPFYGSFGPCGPYGL